MPKKLADVRAIVRLVQCGELNAAVIMSNACVEHHGVTLDQIGDIRSRLSQDLFLKYRGKLLNST